ncbi:MAG: T9SS type A sorting domain-containing protein, partial [Bacteroidia bacterium]
YSLRFCAMSSHGCSNCINEGLLIMPNTTSIANLNYNNIQYYKYTNGVMHFIPKENDEIALYDLNGRLLANSPSQGTVPFHISKNQVFILKVQTEMGVFVQKIFTQNF